jgi:hypothetical protein
LTSTLVTSTRATTIGSATRVAGAAETLAMVIAMTTGGNRRRAVTATMMRKRWAADPATSAQALTRITTHAIAVMTHGGWTASLANVRATHGTRSRARCTCHAAVNGRLFVDRDREYTLRGSESLISATTTIEPPTHARATCGTFAKRG